MNHIEYRILPIIEGWLNTDYIVFRQLINEWLKEKKELLSKSDQNLLVDSIENCCATFLNSLAVHKMLYDENKYNTVIKDLLQRAIANKSWHVGDQSLGGFSDTTSVAASSGLGERDLIVYNENHQIISAIEFFRLNHIPGSTEKDSIPKTHLLKIFRNEITGVSPLFIIVYCETKSFSSTWEKYLSFVQKLDFGNYELVKINKPYGDSFQKANIKRTFSEHKREDIIIQLHHIFINMNP